MEAFGLNLEGRVLAFCRRMGFPLEGNCHLLCAVSGGVDSMALLHLLWRQSQTGAIRLTAATFDHQLRPSSAGDVEFVRAWCEAHGIPCLTGCGDVRAFAQRAHLTLEEAGRTLRYRFLEDCRVSVGADDIATAHNADDNAETLLLHLLRGTGLRGLGGIPPRRGNIVRPLLEQSREEIEAYCRQVQLPHREDESNRDTAYTRNYLRHQVLPLLREKNPALSQVLGRTAESLRLDEAFLAQETERAAGALLCRQGNAVAVPVAELCALPSALALRLVQEMAVRVDPGTVLPWQQRQSLLALAAGEAGAGKIFLVNRLQGRRIYDMLILSPPLPEGRSFSPVFLMPGETRMLSELGMTVSCRAVLRPEQPEEDQDARFYLRPPKTGGLLIRPRQTGDQLRLPRRPSKTLKKLLQEAKVPPERRDSIPVLVLEGAVAAVFGLGVSTDWNTLPGGEAWLVELTTKEKNEKGSV